MKISSKQLVIDTLECRNTQERVPRQIWTLPWAEKHYPDMLKKLADDFVWDFSGPRAVYKQLPKTVGDPYEIGEYVDDWGCTFSNIQSGVIGEVKHPQVREDDWSDCGGVHIPEELLSFDVEQVNKACAAEDIKDKFLMCGCCPRPFEQLQFIRGTVNLYMDLMDPPAAMLGFIEKMHDYYCRLLTKWAQCDVDALSFMDDWGSQQDLLINPRIWDEIFRPMYKDYIDIAHKYGKKIFMHSDGNTLRIIPKLIDIGLDAMNTQIFCIGVENLKQYAGKITFWGEIDRQHLIPHGTKQQIDDAVKSVYDNLWHSGGCIAQCEFGAGASAENVYEIYKAWESLR